MHWQVVQLQVMCILACVCVLFFIGLVTNVHVHAPCIVLKHCVAFIALYASAYQQETWHENKLDTNTWHKT